MSKRCVYCLCDISDERAIDICDECGPVYIGEKMFKTMKQNMEEAKEKGDLCHMSDNTCNNSQENF